VFTSQFNDNKLKSERSKEVVEDVDAKEFDPRKLLKGIR